MLKQVWIAECDICGATEEAHSVSGRYNDTDYDLPAGWKHGANKSCILCPECVAVMNIRKESSHD